MSHDNCECQGCPEYQELSRRRFLAMTGGTAFALSAPAWLPRVAYAQDECAARDVIVSIFLRGAADGLTLCVPHAENAYYSFRPTIAVPRPDDNNNVATRARDLNGFFGWPQQLEPLRAAYQAGHLLIVHATGSTDPSRSHFDAQRFMEVGKPADPSVFTGWLGRHLYSVAPMLPTAVLRAVGIGYGLQKTLQGAPNALPIPDLDAFGLAGDTTTAAARTQALADMYNLVDDPLKAAALTTQQTINLLNTINFTGYVPAGGAVYPTGSFGYAMKSTAALIKANVGVEAVSIDVAGWDTHNNQGVFGAGTMATLMGQIGNGLSAFHSDMFSGNGRNVTVVVMSEFGRRPQENGSFGCDHGHGNVMFVLGNRIAGGRVLTQWPGLAPNQLFEGRDLQVTIDFRDILAEIVQRRLCNNDLAYVFPGFAPTFRGVTGGDMNGDGVINASDAPAFVQALVDPAGYASSHPTVPITNADFNGDGLVDGDDVQSFTNRVSAQ